LHPGDTVLSYDFTAGKVIHCRVAALLTNRSDHYYEIGVGNDVIHATGLHRFWVENQSDWVPANKLDVGMNLKLLRGDSLIESLSVRKDIDTSTFNLRIEGTPNYFVGPGALVHNAGQSPYNWGSGAIYEATNTVTPRFAGKKYIGKSINPELRGGQHRSYARRMLEKNDLTPEDREFYEFMKDADLKPRVTGLKEGEMLSYMEQKNINLERQGNAENLMNRSNPVSEERFKTLEKNIINDPDVQKAGFCPQG
jgi:hypothetical protein